MHERERAVVIITKLRQYYPEAECTLDYEHPWQLMIAAILAAQCTDARVNQITSALFVTYPSMQSFADAELAELEHDIRSCGLFRNKAKAIKAACSVLIDQYAGIVPDQLEQLLQLPGIGRKIANLILGEHFGQPAVVVDTHCARISALLGLVKSRNPAAVERDLMDLLPREYWIAWGHLMVAHGRVLCRAQIRQCDRCPVRDLCDVGRSQTQPVRSTNQNKITGTIGSSQ